MPARSEAVLTAGNKEVHLLYTNRALADAETQSGKSIVAITGGLSTGASGISEIAALLRAGMEAARRDAGAGGRAVTINDAYEVLDEVGFELIATTVVTAVADVLSYGSKNLKNV